MKLSDARTLALSLMEAHGLRGQGWRFSFDKARVRFGICRHRPKTISLSKVLTQLNDEREVRDTILHEIAHALDGVKPRGQGHGTSWKAIAARIGATPTRCYDDAGNGRTVVAARAPWHGVCPNGHTSQRYKRPTRPQSCGRCSPLYNVAYKITWKRV